jgi:serine/threonine protein kinase
VVLELVEGLSLAELIQQSGRLTLDRAVPIIRQVADGLSAAWALGIVHRDVKPGNILLTKDGRAKVADLGLAWVVNRADPTAKAPPATEGTMAYMAPEQAVGSDRLDFRSDIYALGATFFHTVTGRLPFPGRSWQEVMMKHARTPIEPPHTLVPELGQACSAVISRMMAKDPADRYPDYAALIGDLDDLCAPRGEPGSPVQPSTGVGKSSKLLALFGLGRKDAADSRKT